MVNIFCDGAANLDAAGCAVVIIGRGVYMRGLGKTTNNVAETKALLAAMDVAFTMYPNEYSTIYCDSMIAIGYASLGWKTGKTAQHLEPIRVKLVERYRQLIDRGGFELIHTHGHDSSGSLLAHGNSLADEYAVKARLTVPEGETKFVSFCLVP
jgi:ribonuclease HI